MKNYINIIWKKIQKIFPKNVSWTKLDIKSTKIRYRSINKSKKIVDRSIRNSIHQNKAIGLAIGTFLKDIIGNKLKFYTHKFKKIETIRL